MLDKSVLFGGGGGDKKLPVLLVDVPFEMLGFRCNHCGCVDLPKVVKRLQVLVNDFSTLLNRCYSDSDRFKVTVRHHMDHSPIMKQRRSYNNWFFETLDEEKVGIYSILSGVFLRRNHMRYDKPSKTA